MVLWYVHRGISPAWAKDATGTAVPTHYTVDGLSVTQTVSHQISNYTYPIVADPWLGRDLYVYAYVENVSKGYKVNAKPTEWTKSWAGIVTWPAHLEEVKKRMGNTVSYWNNNIQEQFYCHLAGVPLSFPEFNMESWRVFLSWGAQAPYNCNYPEGGWGSVS